MLGFRGLRAFEPFWSVGYFELGLRLLTYTPKPEGRRLAWHAIRPRRGKQNDRTYDGPAKARV